MDSTPLEPQAQTNSFFLMFWSGHFNQSGCDHSQENLKVPALTVTEGSNGTDH